MYSKSVASKNTTDFADIGFNFGYSISLLLGPDLKCTTVDMTATMINEEYLKVGIYKINVEVSRVAWSIKIDILLMPK